jgi:intracellular sulfur oxidation DsrE/DsrF family protein
MNDLPDGRVQPMSTTAEIPMPERRQFLAQLGAMAAAMTIDADEMRAMTAPGPASPWDTSWLDRLAGAKYRVVFNASDIAEGAAMSYAAGFFGDYHEAHGTSDDELRPVIVFRRLGTVMALNDAMWDKYELGADRHINDSATHQPARRNPFWRAAPGASPDAASDKIETLAKRGLISLVCNIAAGNVGRSIAERTKQDVETVQREVKANLVPGAILVPSGIYALIRAQNAGCAYMQGT